MKKKKRLKRRPAADAAGRFAVFLSAGIYRGARVRRGIFKILNQFYGTK